MKLLLALAAGLAGYCYYLGLQKRRHALPREEVSRWESEGGNVPSVATPSPQGVHVHPAGDPAVRH
jgi:hypothetical protein